MIEIVPATLAHAQRIVLRPGDAAEVSAMGLTKESALSGALARSLWAETYLVNGEVAAMMGIILPSLLGGGTPSAWLMTGKPVDHCRKDFLRLTRARVAEMLAMHGTLTCNVHGEYAAAIRWLRWLGFEIGPVRMGFHTATLRKGLHIGPCTIASVEASPEFPALAAEYAAESASEGLLPPAAKLDSYRQLEASGALHATSATVDGRLIGFITVLSAAVPHYSGVVAVSESFFVAKAHRSTGAGMRLLKAAEKQAAAVGAPGLLVSAPYGGDLFKVLPRVGYGEVGRSFFKKVSP